ncbi:hypothetical protein MMC30_004530 [Trapelia coarctata]|nr:hypothetical protein [Trapelia coarctata]
MAPVEATEDYYAILEVEKTATVEVIIKSYRRLAKTLHPDKNPTKPDATACFQCLGLAYETVLDPLRRKVYDELWDRIKSAQRAREEAAKRQAEAAVRERKRAADEKASKQKEETRRREEETRREQKLQGLKMRRSEYERDMFEMNRVIRRLAADLKRLQDLDEEEARKEREKNSWWAFFSSPIYGKAEEPEGQKQKREDDRLQRLYSKKIKGMELKQKEAELKIKKDAWLEVHEEVEGEREREEAAARLREAQRQEQLGKEEAARKRVEEEQLRERLAKQAQMRREQEVRAAKAAREAEEARERMRRAAAEERRKADIEERARAARRAEKARKAEEAREAEEARKAQEAWERWLKPSVTSKSSSHTSTSNCRHAGWWTKLEGSHTCGNCHSVQRRFAFKCPGCSMIACASCRQTLKGGRRGNSYRPRGRFDYDRSTAPDNDYRSYEYDYD